MKTKRSGTNSQGSQPWLANIAGMGFNEMAWLLCQEVWSVVILV
jgi:hypothetical protein